MKNIENLKKEDLVEALILMIDQYMLDDDGDIEHQCMIAGETACRVLGVERFSNIQDLYKKYGIER